jgi:phosphoribosyl-ATP pyrophosphohydrolase
MSECGIVLERLMTTLQDRVRERPEGSYTTRLVAGGVEAIGAKIREEAAEVVEAAAESGEGAREHFVHEVGDLLYHTMVMMAYRGVDWQAIAEELQRREGTSGLEEKRRRREP